jgi:hypothetical protein
MAGLLDTLPRITNTRSRRVSSYDRSGGNADRIQLAPGATATLADIRGGGVIRHVWCTLDHPDPMHRRNLVLRMYWDGCTQPSVECPIGDFFGQGWGERYNYVALPVCAAPKGGHALVSYLPMPFARGARITLENQSAQACSACYYYIDYEECRPAAVPEGRLHACWRRSLHQPAAGAQLEWGMGQHAYNLTDRRNHVIVDTRGRGHYVGVHYFVDSPTPLWYGEGDDMFFIDGEPWPPSLHGTGTEDYFNTAWGPKEQFTHWYFGAPRINTGETEWFGRTHVYRFHLEDPIHFTRSLRGSIEIGHANCLQSDTVTVAYWYQTPCAALPPLPPAAQRQNMPKLGAREIQRWRAAFSALHGRPVWGHENWPPAVARALARRFFKAPQTTARTRAAATRERAAQQRMLHRTTKRSSP